MKSKIVKLTACAACAAFVCMSAVSAKQSIVNNGEPVVDNDFKVTDAAGNEYTKEDIVIEFKADKASFVEAGVTEAVAEKLIEVNKAPEKVKDILKELAIKPANETVNVANLELLTSIQDLSIKDKNGNVIEAKNVTMTWTVPNLVEGTGEIRVLHYSTARGVYELLKPISVDYKNKTITCFFEDLSPVAVVYEPASSSNGGSGDKTDDSIITDTGFDFTNTGMGMLGLGAVVIVAAGIGFAVRKKRA